LDTSFANVRIGILVVDDHSMVRKLLCRLLQAESDFTVIGEAVNGAQALLKAQELQPDVILLDISLPDTDGLTMAEKLKGVVPAAEILVVSDYNVGEIEEAFGVGVRGYLLKSDLATELVTAVRTVYKKERYLSVKLRRK
jgi:DNA-binding NarL/FixJ family response regulator